VYRLSVDLLVVLFGCVDVNVALSVVTFLLHLHASLFRSHVFSTSVVVLWVGAAFVYLMTKVVSAFGCSVHSLSLDSLSVVDGGTHRIVHNLFIGINVVVLLMGNY
jgi:hypothetical protein